MTTQNNSLIFVSARASFPNILDPQIKTNDNGQQTQSWNVDLIFPKDDAGFAKFMQEAQKLAVEKWKENAPAALQRIQMDRKCRCFGSGDEKVSAKTFQVHPGYAGNVFISARANRPPQIIDADGKPIDPANTMLLRAVGSKIYGGSYVNAVIKPWLQQNPQGIGIRCDLVAIQFARDGEAFGAGAADITGLFGAVAAPAAAPAAPAAFPSFM
jgi:hypothetical protein